MQLTNIIVATVFFLAAVACLGSLSRLSQLHQRDVRVGLGGLLATADHTAQTEFHEILFLIVFEHLHSLRRRINDCDGLIVAM